MLFNILTQVKENFNQMTKILTIPRFYGPLLTIGFTVVYHAAAVYFGFTIVFGWLWLFLVVGVFIAGPRAGLLCTLWILFYSVYVIPNDISRIIQLSLISIASSFLIGYLRRRERLLQQSVRMIFANGNVQKMRESLELARDLKLNFLTYSDAGVLDGLEKIESDIGNTLAVLDGYRFLREEIERVNEWYDNPANVKRMQAMKDKND